MNLWIKFIQDLIFKTRSYLAHDAGFIERPIGGQYVRVAQKWYGELGGDHVELVGAGASASHRIVMSDEQEALEVPGFERVFIGRLGETLRQAVEDLAQLWPLVVVVAALQAVQLEGVERQLLIDVEVLDKEKK